MTLQQTIHEMSTIVSMVRDPEFYFHCYRWQHGSASFVRLPEAAHRFHSSHAARGCTVTYEVPIERLLEVFYSARIAEPKPLRFLFMTDFCGSTLLARALGALQGLFCYNEPRAFFSLANKKRCIDLDGSGDRQCWNALLDAALRLMSRTFDNKRIALIKDQPASNYIMGELLDGVDDCAAVFMYSSLPDYLLAVFREDWRRAYARDRVARTFRETATMPSLASIDKNCLSDGRIAALHWMIQMYRYLDVSASRTSQKLCCLRSDIFRDHPAQVIGAVAKYFGMQASGQEIDQLIHGGIFRQHSKRVAERYDLEQERRDNAQLAVRHRNEIDDALMWADSVMAEQLIPMNLPSALLIQSV